MPTRHPHVPDACRWLRRKRAHHEPPDNAPNARKARGATGASSAPHATVRGTGTPDGITDPTGATDATDATIADRGDAERVGPLFREPLTIQPASRRHVADVVPPATFSGPGVQVVDMLSALSTNPPRFSRRSTKRHRPGAHLDTDHPGIHGTRVGAGTGDDAAADAHGHDAHGRDAGSRAARYSPLGPGAIATLPVLDAAEHTLRLLCSGPEPLHLDGHLIGSDVPQRPILVTDLADVLRNRTVSATSRNTAWRLLVGRARTSGAPWVLAAVGVALPGLRTQADHVARAWPDLEVDELEAELVSGFINALAAIDITSRYICSLLIARAYNQVRRAVYAEVSATVNRAQLQHDSQAPPRPPGHPDFVLARAVQAGILTVAEADVIGRSRLEKIALTILAEQNAVSVNTLARRRNRAEHRLRTAILDGVLEADIPAPEAARWRHPPPDLPPHQRTSHLRRWHRTSNAGSTQAPAPADTRQRLTRRQPTNRVGASNAEGPPEPGKAPERFRSSVSDIAA